MPFREVPVLDWSFEKYTCILRRYLSAENFIKWLGCFQQRFHYSSLIL